MGLGVPPALWNTKYAAPPATTTTATTIAITRQLRDGAE
jgi:hypothetical protein